MCSVVCSASVPYCRSSRLAPPVDDVRLYSEQFKKRRSEATETRHLNPTNGLLNVLSIINNINPKADRAKAFVSEPHLDLAKGHKDWTCLAKRYVASTMVLFKTSSPVLPTGPSCLWFSSISAARYLRLHRPTRHFSLEDSPSATNH